MAAATWAALVVLAASVWLPGLSNTDADHQHGDKSRGRRTVSLAEATGRKSKPALYFSLIKPRVIPLLLVPTVASMLMAAVQQHPEGTHGRPLLSLLPLVLLTMLGGTLAAGGAHAINQFW